MPDSTSAPEPVELREARLDRREHDLFERVDFVLTRMENALGLPPWEAEAKPRAALRLVATSDDS